MTDKTNHHSTIALALSGGGSRAMAFHLGCLRALHTEGLLDDIKTISAVSGGSVLAAIYCSHPGGFEDFEKYARELIAKGCVRPAIRVALTTFEGPKALIYSLLLIIDRTAAHIVRLFFRMLPKRFRPSWRWSLESKLRRQHSRTTILQRVFDEILASRHFSDLRSDRPKLIVVACDLGAKSAFYFAKDGVGSWRRGVSDAKSISLAEAVAASAAYPGILPAVEKILEFSKDGKLSRERVVLTDGGVYDNLGLAPLWPDRDPEISLHVEHYSRLVVSRAGYGLKLSPAPVFWPSRMMSVFESIHARAQNAAVQRLYDLSRAGLIDGFILPYLGMSDAIIETPPEGLITAEAVDSYPTDFSAMPQHWIDMLSKRGEQVTRALIRQHWKQTGETGEAS